MKIRQHCGGLRESMETVVECEPTREVIAAFACMWFRESIDPDTIRVESYGFDARIGWDTYIVTGYHDRLGRSVVGFTDGPIQPPQGNLP